MHIFNFIFGSTEFFYISFILKRVIDFLEKRYINNNYYCCCYNHIFVNTVRAVCGERALWILALRVRVPAAARLGPSRAAYLKPRPLTDCTFTWAGWRREARVQPRVCGGRRLQKLATCFSFIYLFILWRARVGADAQLNYTYLWFSFKHVYTINECAGDNMLSGWGFCTHGLCRSKEQISMWTVYSRWTQLHKKAPCSHSTTYSYRYSLTANQILLLSEWVGLSLTNIQSARSVSTENKWLVLCCVSV